MFVYLLFFEIGWLPGGHSSSDWVGCVGWVVGRRLLEARHEEEQYFTVERVGAWWSGPRYRPSLQFFSNAFRFTKMRWQEAQVLNSFQTPRSSTREPSVLNS